MIFNFDSDIFFGKKMHNFGVKIEKKNTLSEPRTFVEKSSPFASYHNCVITVHS